MKNLDYNIIGSGSSGNAVRIENILIDCGMPFKAVKEDLYKVDTLLITHSHSDHVKESTFNAIKKDFPRIKIYGNADVAYKYDVDVVIGEHVLNIGKDRKVIPFFGVHDVPVSCFNIEMNGLSILYATDTNRLIFPDDSVRFDYFFLESNYDERKLREESKKYKSHGYDPGISSLRHMSAQKCKEYYYVYRKNESSELIELHKSKRFY